MNTYAVSNTSRWTTTVMRTPLFVNQISTEQYTSSHLICTALYFVRPIKNRFSYIDILSGIEVFFNITELVVGLVEMKLERVQSYRQYRQLNMLHPRFMNIDGFFIDENIQP